MRSERAAAVERHRMRLTYPSWWVGSTARLREKPCMISSVHRSDLCGMEPHRQVLEEETVAKVPCRRFP